jgi:hypothetical protein
MASSSHLKPGEKGKITARVDTAKRRGILVKTVEVFSNATDRPRTVLTLKAMVKGPDTSAIPPTK